MKSLFIFILGLFAISIVFARSSNPQRNMVPVDLAKLKEIEADLRQVAHDLDTLNALEKQATSSLGEPGEIAPKYLH